MKVTDESKSSKIEEIIKHNLEVTKEEALNRIKETCDMQIDRINGVYTSILKTLQTLELQDASLLDFFEKSEGNVRVFNFNPDHNSFGGQLTLNLPFGTNVNQYPIQLRSQHQYKIILIAIDQKNEEA